MFQEFIPLDPVYFFAFSLDCHYFSYKKYDNKHLLPDLAAFHDGSSFAEVFMGWDEGGVHFLVRMKGKFNKPNFPHFNSGDSIELFFDTRDVKTTAYTTRFCHHFYFLPALAKPEKEYNLAAEVTHFRTEDAHELCDPAKLSVETKHTRGGCEIDIFIPAECLHGYDPAQFDRLGFTYRINRADGSKQFFSASEDAFAIEGGPSLWASLNLRRNSNDKKI